MELSYLNARIRAWKGRLLDRETYERLINARDIHALINHLKEGVYARDIEISAARYTGERDVLEGALKGNLGRTFKDLWDYAHDNARGLLRVIFSVWEVYNLKTILRARHGGIPPDDSISVLMPAGDMDEPALKELNQQKDISGVANLLSTWGSPYAAPIKAAIPKYIRERHLILIELSLDRFLQGRCLSAAMAASGANRKIIEEFVRERIDGINISMLLKQLRDEAMPVGIGEYFLEGGEWIDKGRFLKIAMIRDGGEFLRALADAVGDRRWRDAVSSAEHENVFFLEEQIEDLSRRNLCRLAIIEPLSIALAICFVYTKIREIKNLRLIVRAKVFNMPAIDVKRFIL